MNDRVADPALLAPQAHELLRLYRPGASVFASPHTSLMAQGCLVALPAGPQATLAQRAAHLLADVAREGEAHAVLIGAVPFRHDAPAHLVVPQGVVFGQGVPASAAQRVMPPSAHHTHAANIATHAALRSTPSPAAYQRKVQEALAQIDAGAFEKVVLSRALQVAATVDQPALLMRLLARNPLGYTFAMDLHEATPGTRTLMGASPELLLSRQGTRVSSHPLAGSIPRSPDAAQDQRRAANLLRSAKDRHEHALVVEAVAEALRPHCRSLQVPAEPALVATPTLWHLGTHITGELHNTEASALELALALHPTPAVCGHPAQPARQFIAETEGFDRGYFAGLVGWCDAKGDGQWAVTIRCAEISPHAATLYAGAGIVSGSQPEAELLETRAKLRTLLQAMGLDASSDTLNPEGAW